MNTEQFAGQLVAWLRSEAESAGARGVVFGLSGGVDSAVLAKLARRAFPETHLALILPAHSDRQDIDHARLVVTEFRLNSKLIELGIQRGGVVLTNDFNLAKVAQVRGVRVLNVNDLANAVKPAFLPGEPMSVFVVKEGKEAGQGVGYLDDGTMVVVDGASALRGSTVNLVVTSVLQTSAGKMIFGRRAEGSRQAAADPAEPVAIANP